MASPGLPESITAGVTTGHVTDHEKIHDLLNEFDAAAQAQATGDLLVFQDGLIKRLPVGSDGQVLPADSGETAGVKWAAGGVAAGYVFGGSVYLTSSGTFTKADYPGLRAVRGICVRAGGGGGGCAACGAGEASVSGAGHAGAIAISFVLADDLNPVETVTVGAGGSGGTGANAGSPGGASSFGSHCSADGGNGGEGGPASSAAAFTVNDAGSQSATGDITFPGAAASPRFTGFTGTAHFGIPFPGANSPYGRGGRPGTNGDGLNAVGFGAGGGATRNTVNQASARTGGRGAPGLVIVELYY